MPFAIPETLYNASQADELKDWIDEQEQRRKDSMKDIEGPTAPTRAVGQSLSLTAPTLAPEAPLVAPPAPATPAKPAPAPTSPLTGDADRGIGTTPRPSGAAYSPYDDVFRGAAPADLKDNNEFISIIAGATSAESGHNPNAVGDHGHSLGLFQMHDAGAGAGMGEARRDPAAASAVMVPKYAAAYRKYKAQGLSGAQLASAVARDAERPEGYDDPNSTASQNYMKHWAQVTGTPYTGPQQMGGQSGGNSNVEIPDVGKITAPDLDLTGITATPPTAGKQGETLDSFLADQNKRIKLAMPETISPWKPEVTNPLDYAKQQWDNAYRPDDPGGQLPRAATNIAAGVINGDLGKGVRDLATQKIPGFGDWEENHRGHPLATDAPTSYTPQGVMGWMGTNMLAEMAPKEGIGFGAGIETFGDPQNYMGELLKLVSHPTEFVKAIRPVREAGSLAWEALGKVGAAVARSLTSEDADLPVVGGVKYLNSGIGFPSKENFLTIIHESSRPDLTTIDPAARGTGIVRGAERDWADDPGRTFWHIADGGPAEVPGVGVDPRTQNLERGFGGHLYAALVDPNDLAVIHYRGQPIARQLMEAKAAGKRGYMIPEQNQVHLFEPQEAKYMGTMDGGRATTTNFRDLVTPSPEAVGDGVHQLTLENGGATFNLKKGDLSGTDAYAVAMYPARSKVVPVGEFTPEVLTKYVRDNADLLNKPENSLGTWVNKGEVYMDVSRTIPDRAEAIRVGQETNQKAIMHLGTFEEIPTYGTGNAEDIGRQGETTLGMGVPMGGAPKKVPGFVSSNPELTANPVVKQVADAYLASQGMPPVPDNWTPMPIRKDVQRRIANWYANVTSQPNSNLAKKAYKAFRDETEQQYQLMTRPVAEGGFGIHAEPWTHEGQPYTSSADMMADVADNKHLWYFTGGAPEHGLLPQESNDHFRAVHDFFGHALYGNEFGPVGEENAWGIHSRFYSDEARGPMSAETRGQNSYVNYRPGAEGATWDQKGYADQKVFPRFPEEFMRPEGDYPTMAREMWKAATTDKELREMPLSSIPGAPEKPTDGLTLLRAAQRYANFKDWYPELGGELEKAGLADIADEITALIGITSYSAAPESNIPASLRIARRVREILAANGGVLPDEAKFVAAIKPEVKKTAEHLGLNVSNSQLRDVYDLYANGTHDIRSGSKAITFGENIYNRMDTGQRVVKMADGSEVILPKDSAHTTYGPVIDRWIFRAMGYPEEAFLGNGGFPDKYTQYSKAVIKGLADKLGWDPDQVQSALWFAWKNHTDPAFNPTQFREASFRALKGNRKGIEPDVTQAFEEMAAKGLGPVQAGLQFQGGIPATMAQSRREVADLQQVRARFPDPKPPEGKDRFNLRYSGQGTGPYAGIDPTGAFQGAVAGSAGAQMQNQDPNMSEDDRRMNTIKGAALGGVIGGVMGARNHRGEAASGVPLGGESQRPMFPGDAGQPRLPEPGTPVASGPRTSPESAPIGRDMAAMQDRLPEMGGRTPAEVGPNPSPPDISTKLAWTRDTLRETPQAQAVFQNHGDKAGEAAIAAAADLSEKGANEYQMDQFWRRAIATPLSWKDPSAWNEWYRAIQYNSMLSGPGSVQAQVLGNALELPAHIVNDVLRTASNPKALLAEAQGAIEGFRSGARAAGNVWRYGQPSSDVVADYNRSNLSDLPGIGGAAGKALEGPGRIFGGIDEWAVAVFQGMEQGRLAGLQASKEGLAGEQWASRVEQLKDEDPGILRAAHDSALRWALKGDMGNLGRALAEVQKVPVIGMIVMPFLKTVYHSLARGVDRSPVGLAGTAFDAGIRGIYKEGKELPQGVRPLGERLADNVAGTAGFFYMWQQAMDGNITGSGPTDPNERARLERLGWQPNSIQVKGKWVQYSNLGPVSFSLSAVAAAAESVKYGQPEDSQFKTITNALQRWGKSVQDNSYVSTLTQVVNLTDPNQDPEKVGQKFLADQGQKMIPGAAGARAVANAQDPYAREYKTAWDRIGSLNPLPGARDQFPVAEDVYGRPKPSNASGIEALTPLRVGEKVEGRTAAVDRELGRLGFNIGDVPPTHNGNKLTDEQKRQWKEAYGPKVEERLAHMVEAESWANTKDAQKEKRMKAEIERIRDREGDKLFRKVSASALRDKADAARQGERDDYGTLKLR